MPKLEIIIGDVKEVSEEVARRTIEEIKERKRSKRHLPEECIALAKQRGLYYANEVAREKLKDYVLACAKGSSAVEYYRALRESDQDFTNVATLAIDDDWGKSNGYEFLLENLPHDMIKHSILAYVIEHETDAFTKPIENTPHNYRRRGRVLHPIDVTHDGIPCGVHNLSQEYEETITAYGGIDTAIIGLGVDPPHIGSNFPPTHKSSKTHLAEKVDKNGNVIGYAMTMGIATLCSARKAVLFASGEKKADGVKEFLEGPITKHCPPSYLRNMSDLIVSLDPAAALKLDFDRLNEMYQDRKLVVRKM